MHGNGATPKHFVLRPLHRSHAIVVRFKGSSDNRRGRPRAARECMIACDSSFVCAGYGLYVVLVMLQPFVATFMVAYLNDVVVIISDVGIVARLLAG